MRPRTPRFCGKPVLLAGLTLLALISVAHARAKREVDLAPPSSRTLRRALARAEVCSDPAPARVKVSPGFRYGCFCGGGYPGLARESGKRPRDMTPREREKLIARYYAVKPVDALDAACRDHDVCWIWNGRHAVACNQAFGDAMRALRREFKDAGRSRCANLALDMQMAASYVLPSASWRDRAEKVLWSPVTAVQAVIAQSGALRDSYPQRDELCGAATDP
ncbi:MAG TPA: hypothetical protein VFV75_08140 [Candidatus Polarisedimenticolaceae bacterium]|nr:hypothetical protein [Candidatus Polarisedimenticolaceae bacterium]